jgi:hypothetical protein
MATINIGVFTATTINDEFKKAARASVESRGQTIVWESDSDRVNVGTVNGSGWGQHTQVFCGGTGLHDRLHPQVA